MEMPKLRDEGDVTFGRRKVAPSVCIADSKPHIRNFLREALEDLDFVTSECESPDTLGAVLGEHRPDLFVIGLSGGGLAANAILEALHAMHFDGKVLIFGAEGWPMTNAILRVGEELDLDMLPLLPTPFSDNELRLRTAPLRQFEPPPNPPVDVAEALHADWLDLWYQPKIDVRSLSLRGGEALVRLRHPTWGTVPPACFLPDANDPQFRRLSEFVITRAIRDWRYFFDAYGHIELTINLPVSFLQNPEAVEILASQIPRHPAFEGMIVEFNAAEMMRDLPAAARIARQLSLLNIGVAVDNLAEDWPLLMNITDFPFVEIKVDRQFISGCGDDRLKQWNCRRILELADGFGARTVAAGVESRADFVMARELGFDLIQGFFFAKPMEARKFARRILSRHIELPA
ncbi:MAG: EAL domain-containing protein [Pseudolabrys sp.]|nr:EAL domain-containing protein [Pseudolabrys sp.]MDP2293981.1 EAL domain-containing protein [Pseudolabrys sp.]